VLDHRRVRKVFFVEYATLVRKLGSLHSLLRELQREGMYQGEHTIIVNDSRGEERTLHVYIDGAELQMTESANHTGLHFSTGVTPEG
jgi:hypothetical protein